MDSFLSPARLVALSAFSHNKIIHKASCILNKLLKPFTKRR
ncbi:FIG00554642: hypothetical protein [Cronobacter dublinensis 1210]|uniref:Uncharacterized protein n=1 Tax=Cronobacter dublinensis 1210 TaxID=1208656 RepID=A0ABM9Q7P6_9ENTR|nr:FIG00554642: hypothetical protein [Cronobacter dublinensis 1210]CCJ86230.1 hypothetical protein BN133_2607 [Cronobacter dublinensis 582]